MIGYRRVVAVCVVALGVAFSPAAAEDPAPKKTEATPPAEPPKQKEPFFGDHFALYLEVRGGPATIHDLENPVSSGPDASTSSKVQLNGSQAGLFTVGWTLPRGRGQYLFTYNGLHDGSYDLHATGYERAFPGGGSTVLPSQLPWWHLDIDSGHSHVTQIPPFWDPSHDTNGNGLPDTNEFTYPTTTVDLSTTVPKDLNNRLSTYDLYYRRDWGGLRFHGAWTAGIRYLDYQGAVPCPAWVIGSKQVVGFGFTDTVATKMLLMGESTKGWGPLGSGEAQFNFFRQRLSLYIQGQAALLQENLNVDSGPFTYFAFQSIGGVTVAVPGYGVLQQSVGKTAWNTMVEAGARIKVLDGFHVIIDWNTTGYLDTVLLPDKLSVPANAAQVSLGAVATYVSRDIVRSTINVGLSFQF
ncbi:MAG TPA: hypothetical protein VFV19_10170 [Candidatus Polarisedimenticolaceae bacterium]|nr:hypothetical protein [Candidatus Polarisedimenticolaceae bacterium]